MAILGSAQLPAETCIPSAVSTAPVTNLAPRHSALVRVTHWITTICFFALLLTGIEIAISHPRFYWGRALHFEAAWIAVLTGLLYAISGLFTGHFRKDLLPSRADLSWRALSTSIAKPLRFERPSEAQASSYNVLQRLTYVFVIFVLFPLVIWTGLALSPAFISAFPASVTLLGGRQSARTIHFFVSLALVLFLFVHVAMVCLAGFWNRTGAMITGRTAARKEHA